MSLRLNGHVEWMKSLTLRLHAAKFGGFRHCDGGDKMFLICHLISQDHAIKESSTPCELSTCGVW